MFRIKLSTDEEAIWRSLQNLKSDDWITSGPALQERLMNNLIERSAIPSHRLRRFTDPDLNPGGRGKSIHQQFMRDARQGVEIYHLPGFRRYLNYFICGPDIDNAVAREFIAFVDSLLKPITSGDVEPLCKEARRLCRSFGLGSGDRDRFFELALECELHASHAEAVRSAVASLK